ncbi:YgiW/YdeI family stress tolerance OB fold protein [Photobacterium leiognathi]|uniref:YgiW/YdeI family stress tolerance OB fold protein n=1 Tax=Photobacterium leiognathi TaxID=553611 RepID=UPI002738D584|nr:NirD/YgiW/YdeI family stress tolerance protein [Photobacterium leiognathi]
MSIKSLSILFLTTVLFSTSALAIENFTTVASQQQGFKGPNYGLNTVKAVLDTGVFSDDKPVSLIGNITHSLGGDNYRFEDSTGSISVEIDHDKWFGIQVTPETKVAIHGEIDKELNHTTIDVDSVRLVD